MTDLKDFISNNFRTLIIIISFVSTIYFQHVNNTTQIMELKNKCNILEVKLSDQYDKIDAIKLDKAVFDATMVQFNSLRTDVQDIRADIKELLKNRR